MKKPKKNIYDTQTKAFNVDGTSLMEFRIADTFQKSLVQLTNKEQKAVKEKAFDIQLNITGNANKFHRLERVKDPNFWSVRVNSDIRIIAHKTGKSLLLTYADHHDDAYKWASNKVIQKHPFTGAAQIVEVMREEKKRVPLGQSNHSSPKEHVIFEGLDPELLEKVGIPNELISSVLLCTETSFFELVEHLPAEAAEALLEIASGDSTLEDLIAKNANTRKDVIKDDMGFSHPDSGRRFALITDQTDLHAALDFPWSKWTVFLHPEQQRFTQISYRGAARVAGSAGTGKTIVALHRASFLQKKNPNSKILLTTFTKTLAAALKAKLEMLLSHNEKALQNIEVIHLEGLAFSVLKKRGTQPNIASRTQITNFLNQGAQRTGVEEFKIGFLISEWENVIDAWNVHSLEDYLNLTRVGRKMRLGSGQRTRLWQIFNETKKLIENRKFTTWANIFWHLEIENDQFLRFDHVIVDESQDIAPAELQFLSKAYGEKTDGLLFSGDLGQRIFRTPFSWTKLGVDVRGKSTTLRVNYRTSHEIKKQADQLLPRELIDADSNVEKRVGTISVFSGRLPEIRLSETVDEEENTVADWLNHQTSNGLRPHEIGVFVRTDKQYKRALGAIKKSGHLGVILNYRSADDDSSINYGTMHLAKGLEFRAVAVMACDAEILPPKERMDLFTEEVDLQEVERTERQLLYVACTRAREALIVSGVGVGSKYLYDLVL
ncbi:MAG: DEAD/DEAH box helicase [Betaproteobacteria bacterium]|nr:DEAD/DEAH box helicase [Betaproteobacteria bacterium]